jgi:hypothetical protein
VSPETLQRLSPSRCYLRVKRENLWTNVPVEDLTAREFDRIFDQMGPLALRRWVDQLRRAIRPYGERCAARALEHTAGDRGANQLRPADFLED